MATPSRAQLLEAAFALFLAHGYDGTGLSAILKVTGLSKGGFYHHFPSKLALFEEVILRYFPSPFAATNWDLHGSLEVDAQKAAIRKSYGALTATGQASGADLTRYFSLFFESLSRLPKFRAEIADTYRRLITCLADAMAREAGITIAETRDAARAFVAEEEGRLYLWAVTGTVPVDHYTP